MSCTPSTGTQAAAAEAAESSEEDPEMVPGRWRLVVPRYLVVDTVKMMLVDGGWIFWLMMVVEDNVSMVVVIHCVRGPWWFLVSGHKRRAKLMEELWFISYD